MQRLAGIRRNELEFNARQIAIQTGTTAATKVLGLAAWIQTPKMEDAVKS
jgi:type IV secretory pathway TrbD component